MTDVCWPHSAAMMMMRTFILILHFRVLFQFLIFLFLMTNVIRLFFYNRIFLVLSSFLFAWNMKVFQVWIKIFVVWSQPFQSFCICLKVFLFYSLIFRFLLKQDEIVLTKWESTKFGKVQRSHFTQTHDKFYISWPFQKLW